MIFYHFWFLRMPMLSQHKINDLCENHKYVLSPADGKIFDIIKFDKQSKEITKGKFGKILAITNDVADSGHVVCIAMNVFNVHFQISPIQGIIKKKNYVKGKLRNIFVGMDGFRFIDNERNEILIEGSTNVKKGNVVKKSKNVTKNSNFKIKVVQIAGFAARRIHCFVKQGQKVACGKQIGVIKFGSMVLLILPNHFEISLEKGNKVNLGDRIAKLNFENLKLKTKGNKK